MTFAFWSPGLHSFGQCGFFIVYLSCTRGPLIRRWLLPDSPIYFLYSVGKIKPTELLRTFTFFFLFIFFVRVDWSNLVVLLFLTLLFGSSIVLLSCGLVRRDAILLLAGFFRRTVSFYLFVTLLGMIVN